MDDRLFPIWGIFWFFFDELFYGRSIEDFDESEKLLELHLEEIELEKSYVDFETLAELYKMYHDVEIKTSLNYFYQIVAQKDNLFASADNDRLKTLYINSIYCYMQERKGEIHSRWIFSRISKWLGAPCGVSIVLGVWDAGLIGATAVLTAPTGIGAVGAGAAFVGQVGQVGYDMATNCGG